MFGRLTLAALLWSSIAAAASVSIEYQDGAFIVTGWKPAAEPSAGWASVFTVSTGPDAPPMFGSYAVENGELAFRPRFPLSSGVTYRAVFHAGEGEIVRSINGPPRPAASTHVAAVYPSSPVLPSNELKLYLLFSAPMQGGEAIFSRIHLSDSNGTLARLPFVSQELWNRDYTRLTLIFDPGRIKRGVKPNVDEGPVLVEGKHYTLIVDREMKDANGNPLTEAFRHDFTAGPAERRAIDPAQWKLSEPHAGTAEPLIITFDRPLDHALLGDVFEIPGVAGKGAIGASDQTWSFQPSQPWTAGEHKLVVSMALEDQAGNRIGRPFDVDEFISPVPRISSQAMTLVFHAR